MGWNPNVSCGLDPNDLVTRQAIGEALGNVAHLPSEIGGRTEIHIRNLVMQQRAIDHAAEEKSGIYIQFCGGAHCAGQSLIAGGAPYDESLVALFQQAGQPTLAILMSSCLGYVGMPFQAWLNKNILKSFVKSGDRFSGCAYDFKEQEFLESVLPYLPIDQTLLPDLRKTQDHYKKEIMAYFDEVLACHQKNKSVQAQASELCPSLSC